MPNPRALRAIRPANLVAAILLALAFTFPALSALAADAPGKATVAQHGMVVSESDYAARAGVEILKAGGNAIDAAAATSLAVGVTNPASCGIGGGGFMLIYIAKSGAFYALDYRETAPMLARSDMFMRDGKPQSGMSQNSVFAVAVPGEIAGLDTALRRFGTMKFHQIAAPAVKLAESGFAVSPHLADEIAHMTARIKEDPGMREVFLKPDGSPVKAGDTITEKNLAATLKRLDDDPVAIFYHGEIAKQIAAFMKQRGGLIGVNDLAQYRPVWRIPIRRAYEGYEVYAMPPPSSGGVVLEMLGMLEKGHLAGLGLNSPPYLTRLIEVMRQGFIDRARYADPAFVGVPIQEFLTDSHILELRERALHKKSPPKAAAAHDHGTTNLLVADKDGNVVALTTTTNTVFGSIITVPELGIILNDEMDDFATAPGVPNAYHLEGEIANQIRPGKRPLSSMTPIIVTKNGRPVMTTGGSGGPTIISGVLQVMLNVLDFHLDVASAVEAPRIHEQAAPDVVIVEEAMPVQTRSALEQMGYKLKVVPALGAVGAMTLAPSNIRGAFDPRKGGGAEGY